MIGNPKKPTPNFPSANSSTNTISSAAAQSAVTTAVAALNSATPAQAIAAVNKEIVKSGGSPISVGYGGILRTADGAPVLGGDGKPVTVGSESPTLGSGITSADKASMFGGTGFGAVTGTGQNATPAATGSIGQSLSQAVSSLAKAAQTNPAVTKAALSFFGPIGFAVSLALSLTKTVVPVAAVVPPALPNAVDFEATDWSKEAAAENSPVPSSEQKSADAAQFGGSESADSNGAYSNSLSRSDPDPSGGGDGPP